MESDDSYEDWPTGGLKVTTVTKIDNAVGASVTTDTRIGRPRVQIDDNHEEWQRCGATMTTVTKIGKTHAAMAGRFSFMGK